MNNNYEDYNDNYISKLLITQLTLTENQITELLGYHYHNNIPKKLKIELTETIILEYSLLAQIKEDHKVLYELSRVLHKEIKNIEKVESIHKINIVKELLGEQQ